MNKYFFNREHFKRQGYTDDEIDKFLNAERAKGKDITITTDNPTPPENTSSTPESTNKGRSLLANVLPILGGVGGSLIAGPAGGAIGMGLGETGAEILSGEQLDPGKIAINAVTGAIPFGKGGSLLTKALLPGAAAGGLSALEQDNATPQSVVSGATTGALGAGILSKILPGSGKLLTKASEGVDNTIVNPKVAPSIFGAAQEKEIVDAVKNPIFGDLFKGKSAPDIYKNLQAGHQLLEDKIVPQLSKKKDILFQDVNQKMEDAISRDLRLGGVDSKAVNSVKDSILNTFMNVANRGKNGGLKVSQADLYSFKKAIQPDVADVFSEIQKHGLSGLKDKQLVAAVMWDTVDKMLPKGVKDLSTIQSKLIKAAPGLQSSAEKSLRVPIVGNVPWLMGPVQSAGAKTAQAVQDAGGALNGLSPNLRQAIVQGAGLTTGRVAGGLSAPTPNADQSTFDQKVLEGTPIDAPVERTVQLQGKTVSESDVKQAYLDDLASGGKHKAIFESIIKAAFPESATKPLSTKAAEDLVNAQSGLRALDAAEKLYTKDPSVLTKQLLPGKFVSREFNTALFQTIEPFLRLRTGAAAPEQEVKRYMGILGPNFGDSPEVVKQKFDAIRSTLNDYVTQLQGTRGGTALEDLQATQ